LKSANDAYDGSRIIAQAGAVAAAIQNAGGVTALTAAEQTKANAILEQAIQKYDLLGKEAPAGLRELAAATKQTHEATEASVEEFAAGIPLVGEFIAAMSVERVFEFAEALVGSASR